jgi:hypothetical protein
VLYHRNRIVDGRLPVIIPGAGEEKHQGRKAESGRQGKGLWLVHSRNKDIKKKAPYGAFF